EQQHLDADAESRSRVSGPTPLPSRRARPSLGGERSNRLCPDGLSDLAQPAVQHPVGDRSEAGSRAGQGVVPVKRQLAISVALVLFLAACSQRPDPNTLVMIIEASPTNLDPRIGTDAYSERIDQLLFDGLLTRDEHFELRPGLAERWEVPDPLT